MDSGSVYTTGIQPIRSKIETKRKSQSSLVGTRRALLLPGTERETYLLPTPPYYAAPTEGMAALCDRRVGPLLQAERALPGFPDLPLFLLVDHFTILSLERGELLGDVCKWRS